jgi:hypothetical protein
LVKRTFKGKDRTKSHQKRVLEAGMMSTPPSIPRKKILFYRNLTNPLSLVRIIQ